MGVVCCDDEDLCGESAMTKQEYIAEFEKHLRVAEPKRGEILVELNAHLDELESSADITEVMGKPNELAGKYGRVHIGFFYKPWRLFTIPVITFFLITCASFFIENPRAALPNLSLAGYVVWQVGIMVKAMILIGGGIVLPHLFVRFFRPKKLFHMFSAITIVALMSMRLLDISIRGSHGVFPASVGDYFLELVVVSAFTLLLPALFAGLSSISASPVWAPSVDRIRKYIAFETLLHIGTAALLGYFLILFSFSLFDPFDGMLLDDVRAPDGFWDIYRAFTDYGMLALIVISEGFLATVFLRRILKYRTLKKSLSRNDQLSSARTAAPQR